MNVGFSADRSHFVCSLESLVPYLDGLRASVDFWISITVGKTALRPLT